jgi:hypothetical protein
MKTETQRIKEYRNKRIKEGKAYAYTALINDEKIANFARNEIPNKSQFLIEAIKNYMDKKKIA